MTLTLLALILAADASPSVTPAKAPRPAVRHSAPVGALVTLPATPGASWECVTEGVPAFWPAADGCRLSGIGEVTVLAVSADGITRYVVTFGKPDPLPGPTPTPNPVPPVDELKVKLSAAVKDDAGRKADVKQLASIYLAGSEAATTPAVTTAGQLMDAMRALATDRLPASALEKTRKVVAVELLAVLKDVKAPLTAESRKATAAMLSRVNVILEEIGK